jgi:WhiB family redox-sensing transcriptional regulator
MGRRNYDIVSARQTPPVAAEPDHACRQPGVDPEIFFPTAGTHANAARKVCGRCPHREPCLSWALETEQAHGVWGGLTAEERHNILRGAA